MDGRDTKVSERLHSGVAVGSAQPEFVEQRQPVRLGGLAALDQAIRVDEDQCLTRAHAIRGKEIQRSSELAHMEARKGREAHESTEPKLEARRGFRRDVELHRRRVETLADAVHLWRALPGRPLQSDDPVHTRRRVVGLNQLVTTRDRTLAGERLVPRVSELGDHRAVLERLDRNPRHQLPAKLLRRRWCRSRTGDQRTEEDRALGGGDATRSRKLKRLQRDRLRQRFGGQPAARPRALLIEARAVEQPLLGHRIAGAQEREVVLTSNTIGAAERDGEAEGTPKIGRLNPQPDLLGPGGQRNPQARRRLILRQRGDDLVQRIAREVVPPERHLRELVRLDADNLDALVTAEDINRPNDADHTHRMIGWHGRHRLQQRLVATLHAAQVRPSDVGANLVVRTVGVGPVERGGESGAEHADASREHEQQHQPGVVGGVANQRTNAHHCGDAAGPAHQPADRSEHQREHTKEDDPDRDHEHRGGGEQERIRLRLAEERLREELLLLREPPEDQRNDEHQRDIEVVAEERRRRPRSGRAALELHDGRACGEPGGDHQRAKRDQRTDTRQHK